MTAARWRLPSLALVVLACSAAMTSGTAHAAERHIARVTIVGSDLEVLFSAGTSGARLNPASVKVELAGQPVHATARDISAAASKAELRTVVLLLDTSGSMKGAGIDAAKRAATAFLNSVPADVRVGLVAFSSAPGPVLLPTLNRAQIRAAVARLVAQGETALYDGLAVALRQVGSVGQRRVVLLSDGADTTSITSLSAVASTLSRSGTVLDAVGFQTSEKDTPALALLTKAGAGRLVGTGNAADLAAAFRTAATAFTSQLLVTVPVPTPLAGRDVTLKVTAGTAKQMFSDEVRSKLPGGSAAASPVVTGAVPQRSLLLLFVGLVGLFIGILLFAWLGTDLTSAKRRDKSRMTKVVSQYTHYPRVEVPPTTTALGTNQIARERPSSGPETLCTAGAWTSGSR